MPVEDFLQLAYQESGEDELPDMDGLFQAPARKTRPAKKETPRPKTKLPAGQIRSGVERNFRGVLDALETGRRVDGFEALVPVLLKYTDTAAEYLEDPIVVFDQPERLRERCENRTLEFKEEFTAALKRDEALPAQGELLLPYDGLLSKLSNYTQLDYHPLPAHGKGLSPQGADSARMPQCHRLSDQYQGAGPGSAKVDRRRLARRAAFRRRGPGAAAGKRPEAAGGDRLLRRGSAAQLEAGLPDSSPWRWARAFCIRK